MMSHSVKIKVRPNQSVRFPGVCVYCAQLAGEMMEIKKRIGRVTRVLDVPLCADCRRELNRQSGEEERLGKIGRLLAGVVLILALTAILLLTPAEISFLLRLLVALALGATLAQLTLLLFQRAQRQAALPPKKIIRQSASMTDFSWRAVTFEFMNETFSERFKNMNESLLMET